MFRYLGASFDLSIGPSADELFGIPHNPKVVKNVVCPKKKKKGQSPSMNLKIHQYKESKTIRHCQGLRKE